MAPFFIWIPYQIIELPISNPLSRSWLSRYLRLRVPVLAIQDRLRKTARADTGTSINIRNYFRLAHNTTPSHEYQQTNFYRRSRKSLSAPEIREDPTSTQSRHY
uniref:Uncharacterized protein n=1 Tax=Coccidioides posadasii RMSCC 3488 TaxID=454284 RepID=A0A0J6FB85_COCPO|nr:hypothetical protein CPAG_02534 [Coccidioides posadasii RMSCC 3488]